LPIGLLARLILKNSNVLDCYIWWHIAWTTYSLIRFLSNISTSLVSLWLIAVDRHSTALLFNSQPLKLRLISVRLVHCLINLVNLTIWCSLSFWLMNLKSILA